MKYARCVRCSRTIGWVGLVTNTVLMFMKGFVGMVSGSQATIADAMYSAKDLVTSLLVIVGMKVSDKPLDREHPYGHGKIEFVLSLFVSMLFLAVTCYLFIHAIETLFDDDPHRAPHLIALWAALISIAANVAMYFYSRCVAVETNSPIVRTLAKHHHADATASAAVAVGIIGANYLNMPWIDTMVAMFETLHLMYLGGDVFRDAYKGLMDRSLEGPIHQRLLRVVAGVEGVVEVKQLRTRHVGQEVFAEIVVGVDSDISISDAHLINESVKDSVHGKIPYIGSLRVSAEAHDEHAREMDDLYVRLKEARMGKELESEG